MKSKEINNKLSLNKNTIANLNAKEMSIANGGKKVPTGSVCESYCYSDCCPETTGCYTYYC